MQQVLKMIKLMAHLIKNAGFVFLFIWQNNIFADERFDGHLEQISSTPSISASKHQEDLFDTPISMSVITGKEIKQSGAISIPEALKLVPGVLVREISNGIYEVYIRGLENVPQQASATSLNNQSSLIMIDNRPVYNYFNGGTFWENLPIGVDDIDKIEVIRGASSALYGANAMTGVIHIMTKRPQGQEGGEINLSKGTSNTNIAHISAFTSIGDHKLQLNGLYDQRDRYQNTYYSYSKDQYLDINELNTEDGTIFDIKDPKEAKKQTAVQISLNNDTMSKIAYDLSLSHQETTSHKAYLAIRATPFHEATIKNSAINLQVNIRDLHLRLSHDQGESRFPRVESFSFDESVTQSSIEYELQFPQWRIRPGLAYDEITYDAEFVGGKQRLENAAAMLRSDYQPSTKLRFVAAARLDDYNAPSDNYISSQLLSTYALQSNTMLRVGVDKAHRSPFIVERFVDIEVTVPNSPAIRSDYFGDKDMNLTTINTFDVGLRHQFSFNNWIDIEVFHNRIKDYAAPLITSIAAEGPVTVITNEYQILPTHAKQTGLTVDWRYEALNWDLNAFFTVQKTKIKDQFTSLTAPLTLKNTGDSATPATYGGFNANWRPNKQWSFNSNLYYMQDYEIKLEEPYGSQNFKHWFTLNLKASYHFSELIDVHFGIKNLRNRTQSQYFRTDEIKPIALFGLDIRFSD